MILLVPVLDFVASEISVVHRLLKCWATQIQSTHAVSITPTTTPSIFRPTYHLLPVSPCPLLASVVFVPHATVLLPAARPAHRRRRSGRALAVNPVIRRLGPRAVRHSKEFVPFTTPKTCEKGRNVSSLSIKGSSNV